MLTREANNLGAVSINGAVMDFIIQEAFKPYRGKAWLANYKGAVSDVMIKLGNMDALAESVVKMTKKGIFVRMYVMLKFGTSINEVAAGLMDSVADDIMELLELPIDNIEVIVTGMLSKNVARRNIKADYRALLNSRSDRL